MDATTLCAPLHMLNPKKPICAETRTTVAAVIKMMTENRIGCICITNDENLVGIVTERDILLKVIGGGLDTSQTFAEDIMTHDPEYLYADDQIAFALNRMHVGGFRHVPLIELDGKPNGVISVRDILGHLTRSLGQQN